MILCIKRERETCVFKLKSFIFKTVLVRTKCVIKGDHKSKSLVELIERAFTLRNARTKFSKPRAL